MSWDKALSVLTWFRPSDHLSGDLPVEGSTFLHEHPSTAGSKGCSISCLFPLCCGQKLRPGCGCATQGSGVSHVDGSFFRGLRVRWVSPGDGCSLLAAAKRIGLWGCCYRENLIIFRLQFIKSEYSFSSSLENVMGRPFLLLPASGYWKVNIRPRWA